MVLLKLKWQVVNNERTCWNKIRFLDSDSFFPRALSKLIQVQKSENFVCFPLFKQRFPDSEMYDLLTCKGIYTYDYYCSGARLSEEKLPPIEAFYNSLTNSKCTAKEYEFDNRLGIRVIVKMVGIIVEYTWPVTC
jgi:hypothetical protein